MACGLDFFSTSVAFHCAACCSRYSETNGLMIPLENPFPMLKPAGMRKRKNKWQEQDGFSIFIPPTGAVSEVVQEVSRTGVQ